MEMLYEFREGILGKKILDPLRQFQGSQNSGNSGPVFARDFGETAHAFNTCRFLEFAVIGGFFKREILKALKVSLVLFPNPLIDRINVGKILRPFAEDKLFTALLKPAIKWLRKLKRANRRGFRQWFAVGKKRDPPYLLWS